MYACAKSLGSAPVSIWPISHNNHSHRKDAIRGALTSGDVWIFLILVINANGDGAKYWKSRGIEALSPNPPYGRTAISPWPDVIVGILAHWVGFSFPLLALSSEQVH